jgi:phosphoglycolate phosphatase
VARPGRPVVRGVVVDIDGTVTDGRRRLYPPAFRLLQRLDRRGVPVVLATGNVLPVALALYRFLGLTGPIVAENGGLLYEGAIGRDRVVRLADRAVALRALRTLRRAGLRPRPLFTDRWRETEVALEPTVAVARARRILAGASVDVIPTGFAIHLIERGVGKLPTLRRALAAYGIAPGDCLIAGDGENDVPMLEAAGWAVSFRGADPAARAAADFVSRGPNAVGLVEALKRANVVAPSARG